VCIYVVFGTGTVVATCSFVVPILTPVRFMAMKTNALRGYRSAAFSCRCVLSPRNIRMSKGVCSLREEDFLRVVAVTRSRKRAHLRPEEGEELDKLVKAVQKGIPTDFRQTVNISRSSDSVVLEGPTPPGLCTAISNEPTPQRDGAESPKQK
jgi:hypothetical protein